MRRREFILALGGTAAWPLATAAQNAGQPKRIGVLMPFRRNDPMAQHFFGAL
jgi:hypothetical protein